VVFNHSGRVSFFPFLSIKKLPLTPLARKLSEKKNGGYEGHVTLLKAPDQLNAHFSRFIFDVIFERSYILYPPARRVAPCHLIKSAGFRVII